MRARICSPLVLAMALCCTGGSSVVAQVVGVRPPRPDVDLVGQVSSVDPDVLYSGRRARVLLGRTILSSQDGQTLGTVRDVMIDGEGWAAMLVVEGPPAQGGSSTLAVFGIPWGEVEFGKGREQVRANAAKRLTSFPFAGLAGQVPVTTIIGDYATLQSGTGYGLITDVVFTRQGRISALLVTRDISAGGSTIALPLYPGSLTVEPKNDSFYLPFLTEGQASEAGLRVELSRFRDAGP